MAIHNVLTTLKAHLGANIAKVYEDPLAQEGLWQVADLLNDKAGLVALLLAMASDAVGRNLWVTPGLLEQLRESELPADLTWADIAIPAPIVWVQLPVTDLTLFAGGHRGRFPVRGFYLAEPNAIKNSPVAQGAFSDVRMGNWTLCVYASASGDDQNWVLPMTGELADLNDLEAKLDRVMATTTCDAINPFTGKTMGEEMNPAEAAEDFRTVSTCLRAALNLALRLKHHESIRLTEVVHTKERRRVEEINRTLARGRQDPGKAAKLRQEADKLSLKVDYLVLDAPPVVSRVQWIEPGQSNPDRKSPVVHWRRSHYRWVWTGPRRDADGNPQPGSERVPRFIERTWIEGRAPSTRKTTRVTVVTTREER